MGGDEAGDAGTAGAVALCNGDPSVRLAYQEVGWRFAGPAGTQMTSENGNRYLIITGDCRYWAMTDYGREVVEGTLSSEQAASVASLFRLSDWPSLAPTYVRCGSSVPTDLFRFDQTHVSVGGCVGGEVPNWLEDGLAVSLGNLYFAGTPVAGPVRFLLVKVEAWPPAVADMAALWPLSSDPESLALTHDQAVEYVPGTSQVPSPPDAEALRKLRNGVRGPGVGPSDGIPVLGPDSQRYNLFMRDAIPLEDEQGLLHVQ